MKTSNGGITRPPISLVSTAGRTAKPTSVRHLTLLLVALASLSAYLTRHSIAAANTTIQAELQLSTEQMGWILSAFSLGYFVCQIPAGWLGDRIGTRAALSWLSVLWSLFTVWTAATRSFMPLLCSRLAFGMAQAGLVPISSKIIRDWLPLQRRGFGSGVMAAAMSVGGVAAMGLTTVLLGSFDWRVVFRMYSTVGILWAILFYVLFRTGPREHPWVNRQELGLIRRGNRTAPPRRVPELTRGRSHGGNARRQSSHTVLGFASVVGKSGSLWALCAHAFFRAAGYVLFVTWFPAFLEKGYGITRENAGLLTMSPMIGVVVGTTIGGLLVDFLLRKTGNRWISRSGVACSVLAVCALCTLTAAFTSSANQLVLAIAVGAVFSGMGNAAYLAATMDIAGRHTAVVMGIVNMAGNLGAFLVPALLGYVIGDIERSGGEWNPILYLFAAIYLAGALCGLAIDPNASLEERLDASVEGS